jgi:hypothetical protein
VSEVLIGRQRFGLAPGPVQREHAQVPQVLTEGVDLGQSLQLAYQLGLAAAREVRVDALLERDQASLLETDGLGPCDRRLGEVGERGSPPQRERLAEQLGRRPVVASCGRFPPAAQEILEAGSVQRPRRDARHVARGLGHQDLLGARLAQSAAQPGHVDPQGVRGPLRRMVTP